MFNRSFLQSPLSFSKLVQYFTSDFQQLIQVRHSWQKDRRIKILLVDDNQLVRKCTRKTIENQEGMEVIAEAISGEEAIKFCRKTSPDIILMDINMPGINGIEATRRITADKPNIRIIGLSTHDEDIIRKNMKEAGASAYLTKMKAYELLVNTIQEVASAKKDDLGFL